MTHLEFETCLAHPDSWMRSEIKSDGSKYHECILLHTDDASVASENADSILRNEI